MSERARGALADSSIATSRRTFVGAAGGALLARVLPFGSLLAAANRAALAAPPTESRGLVYFDRTPVATVVAKGVPIANIRTPRLPTAPGVVQSVPQVRAEPEVQFGSGMTKSWYDWIATSIQVPPAVGNAAKRSGALVLTGSDGNETGRLNFTNALISAITFPKLDAASKDPATMTVRFVPESSESFSAPSAPRKHGLKPALKPWECCNFRLKIKGMDAVTPWILTVQPPRADIEIHSLPQLPGRPTVPGRVRFGSMVVTADARALEAFSTWLQQQVLGPHPRTATLELLAPDNSTVLGTVNFKGVGIFKVAQTPIDANGDKVARVQVEMYVESMTFDLAGLA